MVFSLRLTIMITYYNMQIKQRTKSTRTNHWHLVLVISIEELICSKLFMILELRLLPAFFSVSFEQTCSYLARTTHMYFHRQWMMYLINVMISKIGVCNQNEWWIFWMAVWWWTNSPMKQICKYRKWNDKENKNQIWMAVKTAYRRMHRNKQWKCLKWISLSCSSQNAPNSAWTFFEQLDMSMSVSKWYISFLTKQLLMNEINLEVQS